MSFVFYCSVLETEYTEFELIDRCTHCALTSLPDHKPRLILDMTETNEHISEPNKIDNSTPSSSVTTDTPVTKEQNPFYPDARIHAISGGKVFRKGGTVIAIFCSSCEKCKDKKYAECTADKTEQNNVYASFPKEDGSGRKRYKYLFSEVGFEEPLPLKQENFIDLSHRDIRPLATAILKLSIEDFNMEYPDDLEKQEICESETQEEQDPFKQELEEEVETDEEVSHMIDEFFRREADDADTMYGTEMGFPI